MVLRALWLWALAALLYSVNAEITCLPERFGVNINVQDCLRAGQVFFTSLRPQQRLSRRIFSLYNQDWAHRIPQGNTFGSCAVGFDIADGNQDTITTSWEKIRVHIANLLSECPGRRHVGGFMRIDGLVILVTNPTQVSGYGTCIASPAAHGRPVPRRLNLVECLVTHGLGMPPAAAQAVVQEAGPAASPRPVSPDASQGSRNNPYGPAPILPPRPPALAALQPEYRFRHGDDSMAAAGVGAAPNPVGASHNRLVADHPPPVLPVPPLGIHEQAGPSRPLGGLRGVHLGAQLRGALYLPPGGVQGFPRGESPVPREGSPVGSQWSVHGTNSPAAQGAAIGAVQGPPRPLQGHNLGPVYGGAQGAARGGPQGGL